MDDYYTCNRTDPPTILDSEYLLQKAVYEMGQSTMEHYNEALTTGDIGHLIETLKIDCKKVLKRSVENFLYVLFSDTIRQTFEENEQTKNYLNVARESIGCTGASTRFWITFNPRDMTYEEINAHLHELKNFKNFLRVQYVIETRSTDGTLSGIHAHFVLELKEPMYKSALHQRLFSRWKKYIGDKRHIMIMNCADDKYYKGRISYMKKDKSDKHPDDKLLYPALKEITDLS